VTIEPTGDWLKPDDFVVDAQIAREVFTNLFSGEPTDLCKYKPPSTEYPNGHFVIDARVFSPENFHKYHYGRSTQHITIKYPSEEMRRQFGEIKEVDDGG